MKAKWMIIAFAMGMLALPGLAFADFANLTVTDDTSLLSGSGVIYGSDTSNYLQVESGATAFSMIVKADISGYGSYIITNATYCGYALEVYGGGLPEVLAHHVDNQTWNEMEISGLDYPTYNATYQSNSTTQGGTPNGFYCFDVTNGIAQDALASETYTSFILIPIAQDNAVLDTYMRSKDDTSEDSQYLQIEFSIPTTTTTSTVETTTTTIETTIPTTTTILDLNDTEYSTCLDNSTLKVVEYQQWFYKGNITGRYVETIEYCTFGCDNVAMECKSDPFWVIAFAVVGIVGGIAFLSWAFKRFG
jgi:hypothetical protein